MGMLGRLGLASRSSMARAGVTAIVAALLL